LAIIGGCCTKKLSRIKIWCQQKWCRLDL